jgi:hypothetical protein
LLEYGERKGSMVDHKEGKGVQKKRSDGDKAVKGIEEWMKRDEGNVLIHRRGEKG